MSEHPAVTRAAPRASILIPAHDEEQTIGRLLSALFSDAHPGEFEIVVVCNGCRDATADVARSFGQSIRVIELADAGKHAALKVGDAESQVFPRIYVDADVEITSDGIRALCASLDGGALAAGPQRRLMLEHSSRLVRAYYAVWERLPQVRTGLFGRGVVAVSAAGNERIRSLPSVMSDDLAMSEAFGDADRVVVSAAGVAIRPPRTFRDLLRRRTRAIIGNSQLDASDARSAAAKTSWAVLGQIVRDEPAMVLRLPVFVAVAALATVASRRAVRTGDFSTWYRDESSRTATP